MYNKIPFTDYIGVHNDCLGPMTPIPTIGCIGVRWKIRLCINYIVATNPKQLQIVDCAHNMLSTL